MSLRKIIAAEFLYYGQPLNTDQLLLWCEEMQNLDEEDVASAYKALRKKGFNKVPFPSDIYSEIFKFPSSDEAWALVPKNEADTVVWCEEMRIAYGVCAETLKTDAIAARMAFKRSYESEVIKAIHQGTKPTWGVSEGFSKSGLELAIKRAVERGWMTPEQAHKWNPETSLTYYNQLQIEGPKETFTPEVAEENLQKLKNLFKIKEINCPIVKK